MDSKARSLVSFTYDQETEGEPFGISSHDLESDPYSSSSITQLDALPPIMDGSFATNTKTTLLPVESIDIFPHLSHTVGNSFLNLQNVDPVSGTIIDTRRSILLSFEVVDQSRNIPQPPSNCIWPLLSKGNGDERQLWNGSNEGKNHEVSDEHDVETSSKSLALSQKKITSSLALNNSEEGLFPGNSSDEKESLFHLVIQNEEHASPPQTKNQTLLSWGEGTSSFDSLNNTIKPSHSLFYNQNTKFSFAKKRFEEKK